MALQVVVGAFPYTFFIGSKSWDLLSSEPPRGDSSATESRFATSWVIASPHRKRLLKRIRVEVDFRSQPFSEKMSVFAVVTTPGQHPKKRIPLGFHGVSDQKEGQFLKREESACLYF